MHKSILDNPLSQRLAATRNILALLLIVILVAGTYHQPANLTAEDPSTSFAIERIFEQAEEAMAVTNWQKARMLLTDLDPDLQEKAGPRYRQTLQWCRANIAVEKRYADPTLAKTMPAMDQQLALGQLEEVLQLIQDKYYTPVDLVSLMDHALLQMIAVLQHPQLQQQFPADATALLKLSEDIEKIYTEHKLLMDQGHDAMMQTAKVLSDACSRYGLEKSWALLEIAYGFAQSLDTYSYLLSPAQYQSLQDRLSGFYVGIGIDIVPGDGYPVVFDVIPDSPADHAGMQPGDVLISASKHDLKHLTSELLGKYLSTRDGNVLPIRIKRGRLELSLNVPCELIDAPTVRCLKQLGEDKSIGYFRIAGFDRDTAFEMRRAIDRLRQQGISSLMIDLRYNGGGMMSSAIDAVRLFMDQGIITTVHSGRDTAIYRAGGDGFNAYQIPLTLLVDQNTASAAEIFVAALKDHQRATVIGQKTFGKGIVQTIYHLKNSDSALCLTTASFVPPSEKSFHLKGILPDISVKNTQSKAVTELFTAAQLDEDPTFRVALQRIFQNNTF